MKINPKLIALVVAHYPDDEGAEVAGVTEREFSTLINRELAKRGYGFIEWDNREEDLTTIYTPIITDYHQIIIKDAELAVQFHFDSQPWPGPRSLVFCRKEDKDMAQLAATCFLRMGVAKLSCTAKMIGKVCSSCARPLAQHS